MFIKYLCYLIMKLKGWEIETRDIPSKFILIGAPHTSNWDFFAAMALLYKSKINAKFIIKKEWLKFPFKSLFTYMGAIGLDRQKTKNDPNSNLTEKIAHLFQDYKELALAIAPEGTRAARETWKSGFYYIAQKANVPIILGYADYKKKIISFGETIVTKNFEEDMRKIMLFYKNITPCHPDKFKLDSRFS